jgi:signal transduction histidine kinase
VDRTLAEYLRTEVLDQLAEPARRLATPIGLMSGHLAASSMGTGSQRRKGPMTADQDVPDRIEEEQSALRRVATLVARGAEPAALFASVVEEVVALFGADLVAINRLDPDNEVVLVASQGLVDPQRRMNRYKLGPRFAAVVPVYQAGRAVRFDAADMSSLELPEERRAQQLLSSVNAGILVEGRIWGLMGVGSRSGLLPPDTEQRLVRFTELIAIAVAGTLARAKLRDFAGEQGALRRVATLVARGAPPEEVLAAITEETGRLLGVNHAVTTQYSADYSRTLVSAWSSTDTPLREGSRKPLGGRNVNTLVFETGQAARIDDYGAASGHPAEDAWEVGLRASVAVPISLDARLWGAMGVASTEGPLPPDTEDRLAGFTELAATAIANTEARTELRQFADEQAALRRVATLVARGAPPEGAFAAVTEEAGRVLAVDGAVLEQYAPDGTDVFVGVWSCSDVPLAAVGSRVPLGGENVSSLVFRTGQPGRIDDYNQATGTLAELARQTGLRSSAGVPVTVDGRLWGVLSVVSRSSPLPPGTETRLARFTELAATAVANAEARAALTVSRARIVAAADATRRRIEGQLNEAAQQRLVSLVRQLRAAQAAAPSASELGQRLERMITETNDVLEQLREIARGLHPAVLADGGLHPALTALAARSAVPVRLDVRVAGRLPEPAELTAYYAVSEALTNIAKHAHASGAQVDVAAEPSLLRVRVRDDGRGGADFSRGSGLTGLRDRVEAVGGQISLRSDPGAGTTVEITLPLRKPARAD